MQTQSSSSDTTARLNAPSQPASSDHVGVEVSLKLYSYPKCDREPVKILVIGSRDAVNTIIKTLHQLRFAETVEWINCLPNPDGEQTIQLRPGDVIRALVKYLPRSK